MKYIFKIVTYNNFIKLILTFNSNMDDGDDNQNNNQPDDQQQPDEGDMGQDQMDSQIDNLGESQQIEGQEMEDMN